MPTQTAFVTGGSGFVGRTLIPYLVERGIAVRALARSDAAAAAVEKLGAATVRGDVVEPLPAPALRGVDVVFHSAAFVKDWGEEREAFAANVEGTRHLLDAARAAGVPRFVRPRFIWGAGDTTLLPKLIQGARDGSLRWIGDGRYPSSTCHVRNCCKGILKAAQHGAPGGIYFLTDGDPVPFRDFIEAMLRGQGVTPPTATVPRAVAKAFSWLTDTTACSGWDALHSRT